MKKIKVFILFAYLLPSLCFADLIKIDFTASISDITEYFGEISSEGRGDHNFHDDAFFLGLGVSGSLTYDTSTAPSLTFLDDPLFNLYNSVIDFEISFGSVNYNLNGWPYSHEPRGSSQIHNDDEGLNRDRVSFSSPLFYTQQIDLGDGLERASATLHLYDRDGDAVDSTSLPTNLVLDDFEYKSISFLHATRTGTNFPRRFLFMDSTITSLSFTNITSVPEPSAFAIFVLGLMGLVLRRFKKQ